MKLLILTQVIDKEDSMLGFFHVWVKEFSKQFTSITVVCLYKGECELPDNVRVLSLGKEEGVSKLTYVKRFFTYILKYRKEYDGVYVHMNQEYVLLGGWLWRLLGKKVTLWRNHFAGSLLTDVASLFCHKVFCTSQYSYTAKYGKTVFMPVGISEELFYVHKDVKRVPHSILSLVRISSAKKIEQLIEALSLLQKKNVVFTATICGTASPEHKAYEKKLHNMVEEKGLSKLVSFEKGVTYEEVPKLFAGYDISVNQSPSGMYDKTIFEAMMCETLALSCNENLRGVIDNMFLFTEDDVSGLADRLEGLLTLTDSERDKHAKKLSEYAKSTHSLSHLAFRLREEIEKI